MDRERKSRKSVLSAQIDDDDNEGASSTQNGKPMKSKVHFILPSSNISSMEIDVNIYIRKAWTAIDSLLPKWKSSLSDKIKRTSSKL